MTTRATSLLALALLVTSLGVGAWIVIQVRVVAQNANIAMAYEQLSLDERRDEQLRGVRALLRDTEAEQQEIDSYFVGADGIVQFLEELESLTRSTHAELEITSVDVKVEEESTSALEELSIILSVAGSWREVTTYLARLEALPYPITVSSVQFTQTVIQGANGWTIRVSFITPKLKSS